MVTSIVKLRAGQKVSMYFMNDFKSSSGVNANTNLAGYSSVHLIISYFTGYLISE